jgi:hypothetical protein
MSFPTLHFPSSQSSNIFFSAEIVALNYPRSVLTSFCFHPSINIIVVIIIHHYYDCYQFFPPPPFVQDVEFFIAIISNLLERLLTWTLKFIRQSCLMHPAYRLGSRSRFCINPRLVWWADLIRRTFDTKQLCLEDVTSINAFSVPLCGLGMKNKNPCKREWTFLKFSCEKQFLTI